MVSAAASSGDRSASKLTWTLASFQVSKFSFLADRWADVPSSLLGFGQNAPSVPFHVGLSVYACFMGSSRGESRVDLQDGSDDLRNVFMEMTSHYLYCIPVVRSK